MSGSDEAGTAREVAPGRLAKFEEDEDLPPISLPPRKRAARHHPREAPAAAPTVPAVAPVAPVVPVEAPPPPAAAVVPVEAPPPAAAVVPVAPAQAPVAVQVVPADPQPSGKGPKGPKDIVRASNVHIPVALLQPLEAKCKAAGLSHGEVIIVAIESTYPRLKDLINPVATAGGSLFAARRSRASRSADGPLTPLNYRLREGDFETLDHLVAEFGASSRGHLITAALTDYFRDQL